MAPKPWGGLMHDAEHHIGARARLTLFSHRRPLRNMKYKAGANTAVSLCSILLGLPFSGCSGRRYAHVGPFVIYYQPFFRCGNTYILRVSCHFLPNTTDPVILRHMLLYITGNACCNYSKLSVLRGKYRSIRPHYSSRLSESEDQHVISRGRLVSSSYWWTSSSLLTS